MNDKINYLGWGVLLVGSFVVCTMVGSILIWPFHPLSATEQLILWELRLPRVLLALLAGGSLSLAGVLYQGCLRNPLADPYLLGISSGGALGGATAIFFFPGTGLIGITIAAFIGAISATFLSLQLAQIRGESSTLALILSGVAVNYLLTALLTLLIIQSQALTEIYRWLLGGLERASWSHVRTLAMALPIIWLASWPFRGALNAMAFGDETAHTLGVSVKRTRWILLGLGSLLAALTVAACGMIGFLGLMTPHLIRMRHGGNYQHLLLFAPWLGGLILVWADLGARTLLAPTEIPVGVITALLGVPFFLFLLRHRKETP